MSRVQARIQQPNARALYSYAAIQIWADAVDRAGTADSHAVTEALHAGEFDTILGTVGFDAKGDVTGHEPFAWYVWQDGEYRPVDPAKLTE